MLTVACVYWKGYFEGREDIFNSIYVDKLFNMVKRNLTIPFNFVCLTNYIDHHTMYDTEPLQNNWPGWWSKVELFRPGLFEGRVLYIDLDTLILKDLSAFVNFPSNFATIRTLVSFEEPSVVSEDEYRSGRARVKRGGKWEVFMYNSSVMVWDVSKTSENIYNHFTLESIQKYRGDQDYLADVFPLADIFPRGWVRKLKEIDGNSYDDCKIILCTPTKNEQVIKNYELVTSIWK